MRFVRFSALVFLVATWLSACSGRNGETVYTGVVEGTSVQVPALTGGEILALYADTGEEVTAGQVLAQVDTTELSLQRIQAEAALGELAVQEEIAVTAHGRAVSELEYVRQSRDRLANLLESNAVTQQAFDDAANRLTNAESAELTSRQQVLTVRARRKQVAAQLALVRKRIRDATVASPIGGTITAKYFEAGEAVPSMNPLYEVIALDEVWVKIYVGEKTLPGVRSGQEVRVRVDGLDRTLAGSISWISPKAEFTPKQILTPEVRTSLVYAVKVTIPNPEGILKHGMPVEVEL